MLAHFEMTVRSFYSSLAKAIHQHPRRRGDESLPVSGPMRSVALYLGLVMKSSFEKLTQNDQASTLQARLTLRIRSLLLSRGQTGSMMVVFQWVYGKIHKLKGTCFVGVLYVGSPAI